MSRADRPADRPDPPPGDAAGSDAAPVDDAARHAAFARRAARLFVDPLLARDRASDSIVSVAGTGLLAAAAINHRTRGRWPVLLQRALSTLTTLYETNPTANGGWFSHFTTPAGVPLVGSEVSTIDTALLLASYRDLLGRTSAARQSLPVWREFKEFLRMVTNSIDLSLVTRDGKISHGFRWPGPHGVGRAEPIEHLWDDTAEGVLVYWLFGSRLAAEGRRRDWWQPAIERVDYPLFVYVYPLCLDARCFDAAGEHADYLDQRDRWRSLLIRCLEHQQRTYGFVGQTATDGPDGYSVGSPSVIAPVLLDALADDPGLPYIAETLATLDARGIARTTMAYDMATGWQSDDVISIDVGSAALTRDAIARHGSLQ